MDFGCDLIIILLEKLDIRIEYLAVNPIDIIIKIDNKLLILDEIIFSMITSFEKNPDINGIPIRAILVIPRVEIIKGLYIKFDLIIRISW